MFVWQDLAKCKGLTELFVGNDGDDRLRRSRNVKLAKKICATCPVQTPCFNYADEHNIQYGVWGGYTMSGNARRRRAKKAS